ncbi:F-box protein At3g07870-like [Papaver somniferum]|uniref:F-box protein At3g07870-like n=1 Tax=Papaver somniferum TaxID=3469 RepID=UPI000E6F96F6|nr:F-box protein At3g07870-like [Papaver somniferum]XP_026442221.1 F-box protein At3g07870-like [Papaver somniferum]
MKINRESVMDSFTKLPLEIALAILTRVPVETVLDCKSVCRNWRKIVDIASKDQLFIQAHLYHLNQPSAAEDSCKLGFLALTERGYYYFEYNDNLNYELAEPIDEKKINTTKIGNGALFVGSCNGLICLARQENERPVCVYNPLTKEYVVLPEIRNRIDPYVNPHEYDDWSFGFRYISATNEYNPHEYDDWSFGFGYISATNEYKVVGINESKSNFLEVYIYTIGSGNGWRDLGRNFNLEFSPSHYKKHGSFASGAIYWIGGVVNKIVTFDLIEEKFCQHVTPPPLPPNRKLVHQTIGVLDGLLYIAIYDQGDKLFDIWVLKSKNDNHVKKKGEKHQLLGWSKELRVDEAGLLAVTKSGGVLTYSSFDEYVNLYDTKASTSEVLWDLDYEVQQVFPHNYTFVSLKELGEEDTEYISQAS